jgi:hypothetical protein
LYAHTRRRGYSEEESQDLTQELFKRLLERQFLSGLLRQGGRFRSFLLTALDRHLTKKVTNQLKTRTFIAAGRAVHARTITTTPQLIFRRACLWTSFLAFATIAFGPPPAQAAATQAWVQRYGSEAGSSDSADKIVTDAAGNVIVAGTTKDIQTGSGSDMLVIKYSGAGVPLWTNRYNGSASALAVDGSGNVFVTGSSGYFTGYGFFISNYATIAYSGAGVPLWTNRYNGTANSSDYANALAVDGSGNVFVTGSSGFSPGGGNYDYATIAYSGAGVPLWTNRYNGPGNSHDLASAVAVDGSGNVFVTGSSPRNESHYDYATIAYSGAGVLLWTKRYTGPGNGTDWAKAVAVDASGNVFVTGYSAGSGGDNDYATIAYSGAGVALWTNRYSGTGYRDDQATAVAVDGSGNVFVTGNSATIAYSGAGVPLWTNRYNGSASAVAVDGSGNVFVTGFPATIAYSGAGAPLWTNGGSGTAIALDGSGNVFVTGGGFTTIAYSGAGVPLWTNRYSGTGYSDDQATAVAVDASGNVFVTGFSAGSGGDSAYATIAYSGAGVALWTNRYNGSASAMAVDGSGNVFVTGSSGFSPSGGNYDYATIAYSGAGVPLWTNRYNGPGNGSAEARAVAVDASGNVFVTGYSGSPVGILGYSDYATIAYSGAGVPLWTNHYNGPANGSDEATAMAVDASGNVFVTGYSAGSGGDNDYATIAYSGAGVPLWTNRYDGTGYGWSDKANAVAVDASGNVFVTGSSEYPFLFASVSSAYATIAYSGAGVALWTNRYNGTGDSADQANAVAVDGSGNVFVTGSSFGDYATIAYSGAGVLLWTNHYSGGNGYDRPQTKSSLAIGSDGAVYVTGASNGLFLSDFATVKYVWRPEIAIQLLSTIPPKVNLTLSGAPNSSWALERTLELTGPWTNLSALLIGANGSAQFQDTNPPSPAGFYRARQ